MEFLQKKVWKFHNYIFSTLPTLCFTRLVRWQQFLLRWANLAWNPNLPVTADEAGSELLHQIGLNIEGYLVPIVGILGVTGENITDSSMTWWERLPYREPDQHSDPVQEGVPRDLPQADHLPGRGGHRVHPLRLPGQHHQVQPAREWQTDSALCVCRSWQEETGHHSLHSLQSALLVVLPVGSCALVTSMYLTISISVERYCGICYPLRSRVRGSRRLVIYLLPVVVFRKRQRIFNIVNSVNNILLTY